VYFVQKRLDAPTASFSVDADCSFAGIKGNRRKTLVTYRYDQECVGFYLHDPYKTLKKVY
jgi:hypothetical protein